MVSMISFAARRRSEAIDRSMNRAGRGVGQRSLDHHRRAPIDLSEERI